MFDVIKNPDSEWFAARKKEMKKNNKFCLNKAERNADTKCKCKAFRDMIENGIEGWCDCGMFCVVKVEDEEGPNGRY